MAKKPSKKQRRVTVALLDETGLLTGFDTRDVESDWIGAAGVVLVPDGCDLAPGKYRWNAAAGRFEPLPPNEPGQGPPPAAAMRAIWKGFRALDEQGIALPDETRRWIAAYGKTLDAKG